MKRLFITPDRCIGCRACELACSFAHAVALTSPALSRIRVYPVASDRFVPVACLQCEEAACVKVCPTQALVRNPETLAIEVDHTRCVKCMMCTVACPFGNIHLDLRVDQIVKCDVCGGDPACARFCPSLALEWAERPTVGPVPKPEPGRVVLPFLVP
ncbi:MAG: 4Fe-4S dicluster domain-containing protein [Bradymonadales bacterium]|nr:4Fe-4S dicluster domain-containing protein [Bradymonadales bacterium]